MRLKKALLLISTFSSLSTISTNSFAVNSQDTNQSMDEKKEIESKINSLVKEQNFSQGGMNYTLFKDLKAFVGKDVKKIESRPDSSSFISGKSQEVDQNASLSNGKKVLLDKGVFKIYADSQNSKESIHTEKDKSFAINRSATHESRNSAVEKYGYKVAYNNQTKKFGVLTGNVIVKLEPAKSVHLPDNTFQIVKSYEHLGLYVVKIPENIQFKDAVAKLKEVNPNSESVSDEQKSRVNVEILENFKSAM